MFPSPPASLLDRALAQHRAGCLAEAGTLYRAVLCRQPAHLDALHLLGLVEKAGGGHDRARAWLSRAVALSPDFAAARVNLAGVLRDGGELSGGMAKRAVALDPAMMPAYVALGMARLGEGDTERAMVAQERAVRLVPDDPAQRAALGNLRTRAAMEREAKLALAVSRPGADGQGALRSVASALGRVASYFDGMLSEYGATSRGISHSDPVLHRWTLETMAGILDGETAENVVLHDIGCGYGLLFDIVADRPALRRGRYRGFDISPQMVATARNRIADPRAAFAVAARPDEPADYTVVAGTYNLKIDCTDDAWLAYVLGCLRDLARGTRRGLVLNMLSSHAPVRHDGLYYADPARFLDFALTELSARATLVHDHSEAEWILFVRGPFRRGKNRVPCHEIMK